METGTLTVRLALEVVTAPHGLLTTQSYDSTSEAFAAAMVSVAFVAPGMFDPPRRHWKLGDDPVTATVNEAD
jgi:hypothetical protein